MQKIHTLLFYGLICFLPGLVQAQIAGLWEVQEVRVGTETMTPVAKWFDFEVEGNYQSGNGWLQNMAGNYSYDSRTGTLSQTIGDAPDEYGPFNVQFADKTMHWQRMEEGQKVTVYLKRIKELPLAPWDHLVGNWTLKMIERSGEDVSKEFVGTESPNFFFRWDRLYFLHGEVKGVTAGIWYIHPHRPELRLISHEGDKNDTRWQIEFLDDSQKMRWSRKQDGKEEIWTFNKG